MSINKVIIVGRLGKDPEVRYTTDGKAIANLTVATSEKWRDKSTGENREKTEWHRVAMFGRKAEVAGEYLAKGKEVYIEGQLQTRKWQDNNGQDRYTTEIVVQGFQGVLKLLGGGGQQQGQQQQGQRQQQGQPQGHQQGQQQYGRQTQATYNEPPMDYDDDIPFARLGLQYPALMHCI